MGGLNRRHRNRQACATRQMNPLVPVARGTSFAGVGLLSPPEIILVYSLGPAGTLDSLDCGSFSALEKTRVAPAGSEASEKRGSMSWDDGMLVALGDRGSDQESVRSGTDDEESGETESVSLEYRALTVEEDACFGDPLSISEPTEGGFWVSANTRVKPGSLPTVESSVVFGVVYATDEARFWLAPNTLVKSPALSAGRGADVETSGVVSGRSALKGPRKKPVNSPVDSGDLPAAPPLEAVG